MDNEKYDRQIRLFGVETQNKIASISVKVAGDINYISAEILKNLVLLGCTRIHVKEELVKFTKKLVPDDLNEINDNLTLDFLDEYNNTDFIFNVFSDNRNGYKGYNICSKCLRMIYLECCLPIEHKCESKCPEDEVLRIARECCIGSISVQEFLKFIQNKKHLIDYQLNI